MSQAAATPSGVNWGLLAPTAAGLEPVPDSYLVEDCPKNSSMASAAASVLQELIQKGPSEQAWDGVHLLLDSVEDVKSPQTQHLLMGLLCMFEQGPPELLAACLASNSSSSGASLVGQLTALHTRAKDLNSMSSHLVCSLLFEAARVCGRVGVPAAEVLSSQPSASASAASSGSKKKGAAAGGKAPATQPQQPGVSAAEVLISHIVFLASHPEQLFTQKGLTTADRALRTVFALATNPTPAGRAVAQLCTTADLSSRVLQMVSHDTEKYMPQPWLPEGATKDHSLGELYVHLLSGAVTYIGAVSGTFSSTGGQLMLDAASLRGPRTWLLAPGRAKTLCQPLRVLARVVHHNYLLEHVECPETRHVDSALRNLVLLMVLPLVTSRRAEDVTELLDFAIRYFHVLFSGEDGEGQGVAAKVNTPEPSGVQVWLERDGQLGAAKEGSASAEGSSSQARVRPPTGFDELLKLVGGLDFPLTEMAAAQAAADAAKAEAGTSGSGEEGPKPGLTSTMYKKGPFQPFFSLVSGILLDALQGIGAPLSQWGVTLARTPPAGMPNMQLDFGCELIFPQHLLVAPAKADGAGPPTSEAGASAEAAGAAGQASEGVVPQQQSKAGAGKKGKGKAQGKKEQEQQQGQQQAQEEEDPSTVAPAEAFIRSQIPNLVTASDWLLAAIKQSAQAANTSRAVLPYRPATASAGHEGARRCACCGARPGAAGGAGPLKACVRCGVAVYCSKDCQLAHWQTTHKAQCKLLCEEQAKEKEGGAESSQQPAAKQEQ